MKRISIIIASALLFGNNGLAQAATHDHHDHTQTEQSANVITSQGVVKKINLDTLKVTITHDPIPSLNWPAMTMRFTASSREQIQSLNVNDKVSFEFIQQGNLSLLQCITVMK